MRKRAMAIALASTVNTSYAQTVFKCMKDGKATYTDAPCMNAKEVDVTPTEGMNKWTGTERKSLDQVTREMTKIRREGMSKGLAPLVKITPEDFEREERRGKMDPGTKTECSRLDNTLKSLKAEVPRDEQALYEARTRFFKLKC